MKLLKRTAANRTIFFIACDVLFVVLAVWLAFLVRFDGVIPAEFDPFIPRIILLAILFVIPVFYVRRLYSFSWSYVSSSDLISLFLSTAISFTFLSAAIFISNYFPRFLNFPRSIIVISCVLFFLFSGSLRFAKRMYFQILGTSRLANKERTLIVGAGDAAEQIVRHMLSSQTYPLFPVGFVDDNPIKKNVKIHGVKVLGKIADIPAIVEEHQVKQLIIAIPSANSSIIKQAIQLGRQAGLYKIKVAPPVADLIDGTVSLKNLKEVEVEDLLGREAVGLDKGQIEAYLKNRPVLITGAAGSIGSELVRQVAKFKPSLLLMLDQDETGIFTISNEIHEKFPALKTRLLVVDINDRQKIEAIFSAHKPAIVFHAAAYKHVPLMEEQPDEAIKNNIFGTQVLAEASITSGVEKFIFISTDKAVNPTSVMGTTKRISEMVCQAYNQKGKTKFMSVRFGNVLNSRGSVIPIFKEQIRRGGPVQVTHKDMKRYFMLTSEACLLVMQAGAIGHGGEVFVLDMGNPVYIVDLAKEMIRLSGLRPDHDIAIVFTGMRPGEKLFEEILTAEEGIDVTQHQKIYIAKMPKVQADRVQANLERLHELVYGQQTAAVIEELKNMVK